MRPALRKLIDGGATATYTYDALNRRVETNVGGARTEFLYNAAGQRVSEWNGNNNVQKEGHYYWGSRSLAFYTATPANGGYALFFEHQDWEGTERARTDASSYASSSPDASFYSLPYGDAQAEAAGGSVGDLDAYHYGMLDSDMETGTDHAQFRQYSSTTGRWMRPDPYSGSYDMSLNGASCPTSDPTKIVCQQNRFAKPDFEI